MFNFLKRNEMKRNILALAMMFMIAAFVFGCGGSAEEKQAERFITAHVHEVKPLIIESGLANWKAANTGKPEDYDRFSELQLKIRQIYSNPEEFALVKKFKESGQIKDIELSRQVDGLYSYYLENQIEPELLKKIVELSTKIEKDFSIFRGTIGGKKVTNNQIREILKTETDSCKRKDAWLAGKQVGPVVAAELIELI